METLSSLWCVCVRVICCSVQCLSVFLSISRTALFCNFGKCPARAAGRVITRETYRKSLTPFSLDTFCHVGCISHTHTHIHTRGIRKWYVFAILFYIYTHIQFIFCGYAVATENFANKSVAGWLYNVFSYIFRKSIHSVEWERPFESMATVARAPPT